MLIIINLQKYYKQNFQCIRHILIANNSLIYNSFWVN